MIPASIRDTIEDLLQKEIRKHVGSPAGVEAATRPYRTALAYIQQQDAPQPVANTEQENDNESQ